MSLSRVAVIQGEDPVEMTVEALERADAVNAINGVRPVLIKPNYINASHPSTGITTDARVVEGVVKYLDERGFGEIVIGEGSGHSETMEAFRVAGLDDVAERWGVSLVDLNRDEFIEVSPDDPLALRRVKVARTALESTIVSVPKLKLHRITGVTLSVKNMMGVMTPKGSLHRRLSRNIADLASIVKPSLSVVDGVIAGEGHETSGDPVEMNLVIAGSDPVAVDSVGSMIMGVDVEEVKHLRYAEAKGLGTRDTGRIEVVGEPVEKVRRTFRRSLSSRLLRYTA